MKTKSFKTFPVFLIACLLTLAIGGIFTPGPWYESLNRAPWTPPNIAFPIVWSILYIFIAISGWQIFTSNNKKLKWLWSVQLIANAAWSWIFFGQLWATTALIDLIVLDALVILILIGSLKERLTLTTYLTLPYLAWLLIATSLNSYIVIYN